MTKTFTPHNRTTAIRPTRWNIRGIKTTYASKNDQSLKSLTHPVECQKPKVLVKIRSHNAAIIK